MSGLNFRPSTARFFPAGRHIIIYRIRANAIYVSRIMHERMDITRHI